MQRTDLQRYKWRRAAEPIVVMGASFPSSAVAEYSEMLREFGVKRRMKWLQTL
jgi:nucleotidyltransferase/DNA polymerase involved in DNA repair